MARSNFHQLWDAAKPAWAKQRRERPAHANPLNGREVVWAALNRLLRLAFALVKNQTYYQVLKSDLTLVAV